MASQNTGPAEDGRFLRRVRRRQNRLRARRSGRAENFRLDLHGVPLNITDYLSDQKLEQHYGLEHVAIDAENFAAEVAKIKAAGIRILEKRVLANVVTFVFSEGPKGVRLELLELR